VQTAPDDVLVIAHSTTLVPRWSKCNQDPRQGIPGYFPRFTPTQEAHRRFVSGDWLDDTGILGGQIALSIKFSALRDHVVAVPSHVLPMWVARKTDMKTFYKQVADLQPWNREVIMLPTNQDNIHWMLVVLYPRLGVIEYFDSRGPKPFQAETWCAVRQICCLPMSAFILFVQAAAHWAECLWSYARTEGEQLHRKVGGSREMIALASKWRYRSMQVSTGSF